MGENARPKFCFNPMVYVCTDVNRLMYTALARQCMAPTKEETSYSYIDVAVGIVH